MLVSSKGHWGNWGGGNCFVMSWKNAVSVLFGDTFGYKYKIFSYRVSHLPSFTYTTSIIATLILCSVTVGVSWTSWFES